MSHSNDMIIARNLSGFPGSSESMETNKIISAIVKLLCVAKILKQARKEISLRHLPLLILVIFFYFLTACNLPTAPAQSSAELSTTMAAQTMQAIQTNNVENTTRIPDPFTSTARAEEQKPTQTPAITNTPSPNSTTTQTPPPCDAADFVTDVTIPDGTNFPGGVKFTKTWRLKNTGVCTWTTSYSVVFTDGVSMNAPASSNLPVNVPPGQTIDLSLDLTAPEKIGNYRGNFKLRNPANMIFGTGPTKATPFYVDIKVFAPASTDGEYSFVDNYCAANWSSAAGTISCTVKEGDTNGYVLRVDKPNLETGQIDDEPGLITVPQSANNGFIRGIYPTLIVKNGDMFRSIIGCEYKATNCNVKFQLDYQIDNGTPLTLATWNEFYDEAFTSIDLDLSSLAGKNVRLILTVLANGSAAGDRALWLKPRIDRLFPAPTATP
jgi:hypothetical protein